MAETTRVNVVHGEARRCLFSIVEKRKSSGDLSVVLRSRVKHRSAGTLITAASSDPRHGTHIELVRLSVHTSDESVQRINVIKVTQTDRDGTFATHVINTMAIKQTRQFEFLFGWRCSSLEGENFDPKKADASVDLQGMPSAFTLCLCVFLGPPGRNFEIRDRASATFNWKQLTFVQFSVVLLWSYLSIPAHESAHINYAESKSGTLSRGGDELASIQIFKHLRQRWHSELYATLSGEPEFAFAMSALRNARHFKSPSTESKEYIEWLRYLKIFGLVQERRG